MYPDIGNLKNAACLYGNSVPDDLRLGRGHTFAAHLKETKPGVYRNMVMAGGRVTGELSREEAQSQQTILKLAFGGVK